MLLPQQGLPCLRRGRGGEGRGGKARQGKGRQGKEHFLDIILGPANERRENVIAQKKKRANRNFGTNHVCAKRWNVNICSLGDGNESLTPHRQHGIDPIIQDPERRCQLHTKSVHTYTHRRSAVLPRRGFEICMEKTNEAPFLSWPLERKAS